MPVITDIVQHKKNKKFFSVFIDGEYKFSLSEPDLKFLNLKINDKISEDKLNFLIDTYVTQKAFDAAYKLLSRKAVSENFLIEKLKQKDIDESVISTVVSRLKDMGYINDERLIREYAFDKVQYKLIGPRKLYYELMNKKFKPELISKTVSEVFNEIDETDIARQAFEYRFKNLSEVKDIKIIKKIESYLLSRGFSHNVVFDLVKNIAKSD